MENAKQWESNTMANHKQNLSQQQIKSVQKLIADIDLLMNTFLLIVAP